MVLYFDYHKHSFVMVDGNYIILDKDKKDVAGFSNYYFKLTIEKQLNNMYIKVEYIPNGIEKLEKQHHRKGVSHYKTMAQ